MSMTSDSTADIAKMKRATWTSTSAPWDRGQRPLLPHDGFDDLVRASIRPARQLRLVLSKALWLRERAHRVEVGRAAVQRVVRPARSRNARQLRVDGHRFRQRRHFLGIDRNDRFLYRSYARRGALGQRALIHGD